MLNPALNEGGLIREANMITRSEGSFIFLDESSNQNVIVVSKEEDRFVITAQAAVEACKASDRSIQFSNQFERLMVKLAEWVTERRSQISKAYLTVCQHGTLFVVIQKSASCQDQLVDELTDLDLFVANEEQYSLISMDVLSLPPVNEDAEAAFLVSSTKFKYHAE